MSTTQRPNRPVAASRFAQQFVSYDDQVTDHVKVLCYGKAGSGKTHFASTFPTPFFIDVERGGKTLQGKGILGWQVPNDPRQKVYEPMMSLVQDIERRTPPFDVVETIVVDGLGELGELWFQEIIGWPESGIIEDRKRESGYDAYARLLQRFRTFIRRVKDLDTHTVFTTGVKLIMNEEGIITGAQPNILGRYRDSIGYDFDEVYYLECEGRPNAATYKAHVYEQRHFMAKSRSGIKQTIINPSFTALQEFYRG